MKTYRFICKSSKKILRTNLDNFNEKAREIKNTMFGVIVKPVTPSPALGGA